MKSFTIATFATLAALGQAVEFTNNEYNIVAGEPFELTWADAEGPVTIVLRRGPAEALGAPIQTVASGETGESFTWAVPNNLPAGEDYALEITDSAGNNFSPQFPLEGTEAPPSSSVVTVSSTASVSVSVSTSTVVSTSSAAESSAEASSSEVPSESSEVPSSTEGSTSSETEAPTSSTSDEPTTSEAAPSEVPDGESKAGRLGSPIALILTVAAMLYFH